MRTALAAALAAAAAALAGSRPPLGRLEAPVPVEGSSVGSARLPWPVVLDLVAAVLAAGAPAPTAVRAVSEALRAAGDPSAGVLDALLVGGLSPQWRAGAPGGPVDSLADALALSARTGMPAAALVRGASATLRRTRREQQAVAARRLAVLVVLPTGLCLLPAFVLLTVAPLVLALLLPG